MFIYVIILIAVICAGMSVTKKGQFNTDYCSPAQTGTVNAVCSVLIILSHSAQYITLGGGLDAPYLTLRSFLSQLVVVPYLFYSGYGIMESIKRKSQP